MLVVKFRLDCTICIRIYEYRIYVVLKFKSKHPSLCCNCNFLSIHHMYFVPVILSTPPRGFKDARFYCSCSLLFSVTTHSWNDDQGSKLKLYRAHVLSREKLFLGWTPIRFLQAFTVWVYFILFYFIFKLYKIVLVLPNIKMNPPHVLLDSDC